MLFELCMTRGYWSSFINEKKETNDLLENIN
jgi:hypothetical protein